MNEVITIGVDLAKNVYQVHGVDAEGEWIASNCRTTLLADAPKRMVEDMQNGGSAMRELAILTFQTLDGVMQSPTSPEEDPSGGFRNGGWAVNCWEEVMEQVMREAMADPYDLLLGRKTYELFASSWTNAPSDDPVAQKLNSATKYVTTSTLSEFEWSNSRQITGDIAVEIARLKEQDGPLLQVHGSWQLIQFLHSNQLIDEYRLWTFPVIVGSGKRLFADSSAQTHLKLIKSDTCPTGATMNFYRPAGS